MTADSDEHPRKNIPLQCRQRRPLDVLDDGLGYPYVEDALDLRPLN